MTKTPDTEVKKRNTSDGSFFLKHESRKICMAKNKRGIIKKASKNEQILPHIRPTQIRFSCSQEKSIYMSIERKDCDKNARK